MLRPCLAGQPSLERCEDGWHMTGTIFALSSGRPPAAIAVIRISGPAAHGVAILLCGDLPAPRLAAVRALRDPETGELLDEALVLRFDGPHSATGEDLIEFQCHGGRAVTEAVFAALGQCEGLRIAEPGEFTRRAFENGRIDLTEAEGLAELLEAETEAQRRSALALADGGLRRQIDGWRQQLLDMSARAELAIDYVGEDDELLADDLGPDIRELRDELARWLDRPRIEALRDGLKVVIAGPPNSGKSSLLNALVGHERAIVAAQAGTTRDHIDVPLAIEGLPVLLTDTAGLRATADSVEAVGVERAARLVASADVLIWLGEPDSCPVHARAILVAAKSDLGIESARPGLRLSARTGEGLGALLGAILELARDLIPTTGEIALNQRQAEELRGVLEELDHTVQDPLLLAENFRRARVAFDRVSGRAGLEDFLDSLFGRFCLGK